MRTNNGLCVGLRGHVRLVTQGEGLGGDTRTRRGQGVMHRESRRVLVSLYASPLGLSTMVVAMSTNAAV